eukprot:1671199-Pyramimonas_sp.AAC.1
MCIRDSPGGIHGGDGPGVIWSKSSLLRRDSGCAGVGDSPEQSVPRAGLCAIVECVRVVDPPADLFT